MFTFVVLLLYDMIHTKEEEFSFVLSLIYTWQRIFPQMNNIHQSHNKQNIWCNVYSLFDVEKILKQQTRVKARSSWLYFSSCSVDMWSIWLKYKFRDLNTFNLSIERNNSFSIAYWNQKESNFLDHLIDLWNIFMSIMIHSIVLF